jgi:hypothetical protein
MNREFHGYYLVREADRIQELIARAKEPVPSSERERRLAEAAYIGCYALDRLSQDREFFDASNRLFGLSRSMD